MDAPLKAQRGRKRQSALREGPWSGTRDAPDKPHQVYVGREGSSNGHEVLGRPVWDSEDFQVLGLSFQLTLGTFRYLKGVQ